MPLPVSNVYVSEKEDNSSLLVTDECFDWNGIIKVVSDGKRSLGRTRETAYKYEKHLKEIEDNWDSIDSFCKHKFLNFPFITKSVSRDGKEHSLKSVEDTASCRGADIVICENEFPYAITKDIKHLILWSVSKLSMQEYKEYVDVQYPSDNFDVFVFENPEPCKSVKSVHHAQVFVRNKNDE